MSKFSQEIEMVQMTKKQQNQTPVIELVYMTGSNNSKIYEMIDIQQYPKKSLKRVLKVIEHQEIDNNLDTIHHENQCYDLRNEINITSQLNHPYIIKPISQLFESKQECSIQLPQAQCDLYDMVIKKQLTISKIKLFFHQALEALIYLNEKKIAHNDIKLENLFVFQDNNNFQKLVLSDFGFAKKHNENQSIDSNEQYQRWRFREISTLAPEMIQKISQNDTSTIIDEFACDIFCLGSCLFQSIFITYPFQKVNDGANLADPLYSLLLQKNGEILFWKHPQIASLIAMIPISWYKEISFLLDLITRMIHPNIQKRIKVHDAYNHPWFRM